jgi:hypothetical protein
LQYGKEKSRKPVGIFRNYSKASFVEKTPKLGTYRINLAKILSQIFPTTIILFLPLVWFTAKILAHWQHCGLSSSVCAIASAEQTSSDSNLAGVTSDMPDIGPAFMPICPLEMILATDKSQAPIRREADNC